jgi:hypothetical protein
MDMHPTPSKGGRQLQFSWKSDKLSISITATRRERKRNLKWWNPFSAATCALIVLFSSLAYMMALGMTSTTTMVGSPGPASLCLGQPIPTIGPLLLTPRGSGDLATTPSVQPASAGPATAVAFTTAPVSGASQGLAGLLGPTRGLSASTDLACFALSPLSPESLSWRPLPRPPLQDLAADGLLSPVRVEQPEGPPAQAVDLPGPWSSPSVPRFEQQLRNLPRRRSRSLTGAPTRPRELPTRPLEIPAHLLETVLHQNQTSLKMEQRLVRWPGNWRLCENQMGHKDYRSPLGPSLTTPGSPKTKRKFLGRQHFIIM